MEIALLRSTDVDPCMALVKRMASGDEEALRSLYAAAGRRLFAYALQLTRSEALAEEVLQDSLLAAWRGARSYRGEARAITWLLGIVHRQALNAMRRKRLPLEDLDRAALVADRSAGPEALAGLGERRQALQAALAQLSADHRAVLELVFYQGLSLAETAEVCACPVGTVKSRLSYAKAHLKAALNQQGLQAEDMI